MKGFVLEIGSKKIYAASKTGISVVISNKEWDYRISVSGSDLKGNVFYTWCYQKLKYDEKFNLKFEDFEESLISSPQSIYDITSEESNNNMMLEKYYRLKQELIEEGYDLYK